MANTFYTPEQVAAVAIPLVTDDFGAAATINRDYEADFGGGRGYTVNVKIPTALKARSRALGSTAAITADSLSEGVIPVAMDTQIYSAVDLTETELNFTLENFARQVLSPQAEAVANDIEDRVVAEMEALPSDLSVTYDAAAPTKVFSALRKGLRDLSVPQSNLFAVVGTKVYADLLDAGAIKDASQSGSTSALRDGVVGPRLSGFTLVESNRVAEDEIIAYHRDAFTLAVRAPQVPAGVAFGASQSAHGFAMTYLRDYDSSSLVDRSVLHTFVGVATMPLARRNPDGTISQVTPALRVGGTVTS